MSLDQNPLQLDSEGIKEKMARGVKGDNYSREAIFQYFHQRGGGLFGVGD